MDPDIGKELYNVMDALVALRLDLECDPDIAGESLVLSAAKARNACEALDSATMSIKHLAAALGNGNGPLGKEPRH